MSINSKNWYSVSIKRSLGKTVSVLAGCELKEYLMGGCGFI